MSEKPTYEEFKKQIKELDQSESKRKPVEKQAVLAAESKWQTLIENAPDIIFTVDQEGTILYINSPPSGLTAEETIGTNCLDYVPPEYQAKVKNSIQTAFQTGEKSSIEIEARGPNDTKSWYSTNVGCIKQGDEIVSALFITRDITDQKQAEESLKDEIQTKSILLDNIPGCIALILKKGTREIVASNKYAREIGAVPGKTCFMTCAERNNNCPFCLAPELWATDKPQRIEVEYRGAWYKGIWAPLSEDLYVHYIFDITERKQTEKLLIRNKDLLAGSQEIAHVGSWELDLTINTLIWSDEVYRIFGLEPQEFEATYEAFLDRVHPEDRDLVSEAYEGSVRDGLDRYEVEHRIIKKNNGEIRYVHEVCNHFKDESGKVWKSVGMVHDITKRKLMENALQESEEKYRSLFDDVVDISQVGLFILDSDFKVVWVNQALEGYFGVNKEAVIGKDKRQLILKQFKYIFEDPEGFAGKVLATYDNNTYSEHFECHVLSGDRRQERWLEHWSQPICSGFFNGGRAELYYDITERKKAEEKLRESEAQFRSLIELNPDGIYVCREGEIVYVNKEGLSVFGAKTEKELIGKIIFDLIHPDHREKAKQRTKIVSEKGKAVPLKDFIFLRLDGGESHVQAIAAPVNFEGMPATLSVVRDVTERRKAKAEKIRLESELQHAQKMESIGTLAGGIAHDFNNILSAIIGFTELALNDVEKDTTIEESLHQVYAAGIRAKDLVDQILTISRRNEKEFRPILVSPLIKEALKMLRSTIPTSIEFKENITSDPLVVHADPIQLHQIVVNLATNAKQAIADEIGVLEVGVDAVVFDSGIKTKYPDMQPGNYARITVSDTGSGILDKDIEKIFEPYFSTKEKGTGTGLGLSVVHGIVKSHNGHITVYSELGKGTTFHVYLPLIKKAVADQPDRSVEPLPTGTEHILLIDDEPPIVKMQQQNLERLGYTVTTRTSSQEALEVFRASPDRFDLVLTDMTMPNMTGDTLAKEIKSIRSDMPVILCTGFSEKINGREGDLDINGLLMKPVDKNKMAKTVRKVLDEAKS